MPSLAPLLLALALVPAQGPTSAPPLPAAKFPARVTSVGGEVVDVARLAKRSTVVVITLKATWCRVCQEQLHRIKDRLEEARCGVTFLVLSPGPRADLAAIRDRTGFPFPFVEDRGLAIARSLGLAMGEEQILPSILVLRADLSVGWIQRGRGGGYFGDPELYERIDCADLI